MGQITEKKIRDFQERFGIEQATDERGARLSHMSKHACDLIEAIALEQAGLRDGDGHWYGRDPVYGIIHQLVELEREDKRLYGLELVAARGVVILDARGDDPSDDMPF